MTPLSPNARLSEADGEPAVAPPPISAPPKVAPPHTTSPANSAPLSEQRPAPRGRRRLFIAYAVTIRVAWSYLWLSAVGRWVSPARRAKWLAEVHRLSARRILHAITRLQGLFIKVGQLISILTNVLPEEFRCELERLQDRAPARPIADVEKRFMEEFGQLPSALFAEFDPLPVAAASIGQVHRARLPNGESVAVKVQYPDIESIVRLDLEALRFIFDMLIRFAPHHGLDGVYNEIRALVLEELDYRAEAQHLERIAANFVGRPDRAGIEFPRVHGDRSTGRILTTSWVEGIKISDRARLVAAGIDPARLARTVVGAYCQQIFTDGVYHADPHPGNILVQPKGDGEFTVVFVDFGAVAEVSPEMRRGIADVISAALARDTPKLIRAMRSMGFIARGADPRLFDRVIDFLHQRFQDQIRLDSFSLKDLHFDPQRPLEDLAELSKMGVSIRDLADHFHVPKEWILLERTVLLIMGLCTELDRELKPVEVIRPYLEKFVLGDDSDWSALLLRTSRELGTTLIALPNELQQLLRRADRGELEVRFRGFGQEAQLLYSLGHQVIFTALGIAAASLAVVFDGRGETTIAHAAWWGAGAAALLLLRSMWSSRRR